MPLCLSRQTLWIYFSKMRLPPLRRGLADTAKEGGGSTFRIATSNTITDRKSKFEGRAARISSKQDLEQVLQHIRGLKAVRKASHPATNAWRFHAGNRIHEGSADDGEAGAGEVLLNLLRQTGRSEIAVTVTRFYGGKPLGSDRFRHIRIVATEALKQWDQG